MTQFALILAVWLCTADPVIPIRAVEPDSTPLPQPQPQVQVLDVGAHDVLPGVLRPIDAVTLSTSFDIQLSELRVEEGQRVEKGQIVAVLDDRVVRASVKLAMKQADRKAQIERAQAALDQAEDALERIREIHRQHAAAEPELVAAESDRRIAAADLKNAQEAQAEALIALELAWARLEEHMIRAPFDAVVIRVHAEPGAMVTPGDPLMDLVSTAGLCVDLYLPADIAAALKHGDRYAVAVEGPIPTVVPASVRYIERRIDPVSRTMRVVFDLMPNPEQHGVLYAGSLAEPSPTLPAAQKVSVPAPASAVAGTD